MRLTYIIAVVLLIALYGCSSSLSEQEIQSKLIEANSNINSYSADVNLDMDMSLTMLGQTSKVTATMVGKAKVDRPNKKLELIATTKSKVAGVSTELESEVYIVNDYVYSKSYDTWTKSKLKQSAWDSQDQVESTLELIKSGTIEKLKDESADGNNYYVFKVNPDIKKLGELVLKQKTLNLQSLLDFSKVIKSYSATIWINQKTFIIERSTSEIKMVVTDKDVKSEAESPSMDSTEIALDMKMDYKISDINKPVTIELPSAASKAIDLEKELGMD